MSKTGCSNYSHRFNQMYGTMNFHPKCGIFQFKCVVIVRTPPKIKLKNIQHTCKSKFTSYQACLGQQLKLQNTDLAINNY